MLSTVIALPTTTTETSKTKTQDFKRRESEETMKRKLFENTLNL